MRRVLLVGCLLLLCLFAGVSWLVEDERFAASSAPVPAATSFRVVGSPSISAAFIDQVLAAYQSPAVGLGQALYDDGVAAGIDPVYALALVAMDGPGSIARSATFAVRWTMPVRAAIARM